MPRIEGIAQPFAQRTQGMQPEPPLRKESVNVRNLHTGPPKFFVLIRED